MAAVVRIRWGLAAGLALAAAAATARADEAAELRRLWAYPEGVLVSNGGIRSGAMKHKATRQQLEKLTGSLEESLLACARKLRVEQPDLAKRGERYAFTVSFQLAWSGATSAARVKRGAVSAPLPACTGDLAPAVGRFAFSPLERPKGKESEKDGALAHYVDMPFQMVIMTDEEAQGRGFQYLVGERAWEKALRTNRHWFACTKDTDCIITYEMCEVRAINSRHEEEFLEVVRRRKRAACREPEGTQVLTPLCRAGVCGTRSVSAGKGR